MSAEQFDKQTVPVVFRLGCVSWIHGRSIFTATTKGYPATRALLAHRRIHIVGASCVPRYAQFEYPPNFAPSSKNIAAQPQQQKQVTATRRVLSDVHVKTPPRPGPTPVIIDLGNPGVGPFRSSFGVKCDAKHDTSPTSRRAGSDHDRLRDKTKTSRDRARRRVHTRHAQSSQHGLRWLPSLGPRRCDQDRWCCRILRQRPRPHLFLQSSHRHRLQSETRRIRQNQFAH